MEIEAYYLSLGVLLPTFHMQYWVGLVSNNATWPKFNWTDKSVKPPSGVTYIHWGRTDGVPEPTNYTGFETCGVANATQTYQQAWGWADAQCNTRNIFICKVQCEWLAGGSRGRCARGGCAPLPAPLQRPGQAAHRAHRALRPCSCHHRPRLHLHGDQQHLLPQHFVR